MLRRRNPVIEPQSQGPDFDALEITRPPPPKKITRSQLIRFIIYGVSVVALVFSIILLGLFLTFRTEVLAGNVGGGNAVADGVNTGTMGQGLFSSRVGNVLEFRNIAPGTYTSVQLDVNDNVVMDVVPSTLDPITVVTTAGMVGGQPVALGGTITLGLNDAQTFTMLSVANDTFLGMYTTCMRPLQPSCYDISAQSCTVPLQQSCIRPDLVLDSLVVGSLTVVNMSNVEAVISPNQTTMMIEELFVTNEYLSGNFICTGPGIISQSCLNLGGYTCPMGMPLADSCIPATIAFTTASVTNTLTVNNVVCAGGPIPDSCVPGTALATPSTVVKRDGSAGFAAGPVTVSTLGATTTVTAGTDLIGVNFNPTGGGTFSSVSGTGTTATAASNAANGLSITLPRTGLPTQLAVGTRSNVVWTGTNVNNIDRTYGVLGKNQVTDSTMSDGGILTVSVASGGSGYAIGNTLSLLGGGFTLPFAATVSVTAVDGLGAVTAVTVVRAGYGYPAGVVATSGGAGSGATINILTRGNAIFAWAIGLVGQSIDAAGTTASFTLTNSIGIEAGQPNLGSGPIRIVNDYGMRVPNWATVADNRYGVYIDPPTGGTMNNYALFFGASTVPSGGISFSTDAQLYRSATASTTTNGIMTTNAGSIGFTGSLTLNVTTASSSAVIGSRAATVISANTGSTGGLLTFAVNAGGSGYVVGNTITITGGSGTAQLTVTTIGGGGVVTTLFLSRPGSGYTVSSGVATTGGTGTGLTVNILSIGTSTYTSVTGLQAQSITASGSFSTSTITTATALSILDANRGSGPLTIGTNIGVDIPALSAVATNSYGMRIAAPSGGTAINNALNFVASTTPSGGITYDDDVQIYRIATGALIINGIAGSTTTLTARQQMNTTTAGGSGIGVYAQPYIIDNAGSTGGLLTFAVNVGGSGYVVGNTITVTGGSGTAQLTVTIVDGLGAVLTLFLSRPGSGYTVTTGVVTTGGAGTGLTINILSIGTSTYSFSTGLQAIGIDATSSFSTSTITTTTAVSVLNNALGSGPVRVTTSIGVDIAGITTASATNIGLRIAHPTGPATATNMALQLSSVTNTPAGGITFGTDVQLYRSAIGSATLASTAVSGISAALTVVAGHNVSTGAGLMLGVYGLPQFTSNAVSVGGLATFAVNAGGSGYVVGNTITITGGSGTAQLTVTTVGGGGAVLTLLLARPGSGYTVTSGVATTGGAGTGLTINILSIGTSTIATAIGLRGQAFSAANLFATPLITNAIGLQIVDPSVGFGPARVGTNIGVDIPALTTGFTSAVGLRISAPSAPATDSYAIQIIQSLPAGRRNGISIAAGGDSGYIYYDEGAVVIERTMVGGLGHQGVLIRMRPNSTARSMSSTLVGAAIISNKYENSIPGINALLTFSVAVGGSGYVVGNTVTVTGGSGTGVLTVTTVDGMGAVLTLQLLRGGSAYAIASGVATTGGSGTGLTINILSVQNAGGYGSPNLPVGTAGLVVSAVDASGFFPTDLHMGLTAIDVRDSILGGGPLVNSGNHYGMYVRSFTSACVSSYGIFLNTPTGGTTSNAALAFSGTGSNPASGILFATDTNLYRSGAGRLRTDTDMVVRHIEYSTAAVPTFTAGNAAGTSPTITVVAGSTDCKMRVSVTAGAAISSGNIVTLTYNTGFTSSSVGATFSPFTATAAAVSASVYIGAESTASVTLASAISLTSGTNYQWNIQVC